MLAMASISLKKARLSGPCCAGRSNIGWVIRKDRELFVSVSQQRKSTDLDL